MKKMFLWTLVIVGTFFRGDCMQRRSVFFDVIKSKEFSRLCARIIDPGSNIRFFDDTTQTEVGTNFRVLVPLENQFNGSITLEASCKTGSTLLLNVVIGTAMPSNALKVNLNAVHGVQTALYRRCMGGGNRFILAIGRSPADISLESVQKQQASQPFASQQMFTCVQTTAR